MPRHENHLRHESRQRELSELEAQRPELVGWLQPLRVSLSALAIESWQEIVPLCAHTRAPDEPLLHGAVIAIDAIALRGHVHVVLAAALGQNLRTATESIDPARLLECAVAQDEDGISRLADEAGLDPPALNAAAQLAALPLLIRCTRVVAPQPLHDWPHRYCHVCGALPALAEVLGLERTRHLRCARCGASWKTHVLLCAFCGERDHGRLGSLVPDGPQGQIAWVETCNTCHGYIKNRAALRGAAAENVLIEDARTLELDLVAQERGYQKPASGAFATRIRLTAASSGVS